MRLTLRVLLGLPAHNLEIQPQIASWHLMDVR